MRRARLASTTVAAFLLLGVASTHAVTPECLPDYPLGCSASWLTMSRPVAAFSIVFADACLKHDLCYRHGAATYGYDKAKCDEDFIADIDAVCRGELRFLDFATLGLNRVACFAAKRLAAAAVTRSVYAERSFRDGALGTCCRYEEGAEPLPQCQR